MIESFLILKTPFQTFWKIAIVRKDSFHGLEDGQSLKTKTWLRLFLLYFGNFKIQTFIIA